MLNIYFENIDLHDINGNKVLMSQGHELTLSGRLVYLYTQPIITYDKWNGRNIPVQQTVYQAYQIKINTKEISKHEIGLLQIASKITIYEIETNEIVKVLTDTDNQFVVSDNGMFGTVEGSYTINFAGNKINSYPGISVNNTNCLRIDDNSTTYNFYTDYELLTNVSDAEKKEYTYNSGKMLVAKTTHKTGYQMLFFLMQENAMILKDLLNKVQPSGYLINPNTDNYELTEMPEYEITELTEGMYKVILTLTTTNTVNYA